MQNVYRFHVFGWFNDWLMLAKIKGLIGWLKLMKVQLKGLILSPQVWIWGMGSYGIRLIKDKIRVSGRTGLCGAQRGCAAHIVGFFRFGILMMPDMRRTDLLCGAREVCSKNWKVSVTNLVDLCGAQPFHAAHKWPICALCGAQDFCAVHRVVQFGT